MFFFSFVDWEPFSQFQCLRLEKASSNLRLFVFNGVIDDWDYAFSSEQVRNGLHYQFFNSQGIQDIFL